MAASSSSPSVISQKLWHQTLQAMPEEEKELEYTSKIKSVLNSLKKTGLTESDITTIALKYRLNAIPPGYNKKTLLFTAVSVVFIETLTEQQSKGKIAPGLYLLLKNRGTKKSVGEGGNNNLTFVFHWESESRPTPHVLRNCLKDGLGDCEIELNEALSAYPEHFATGLFFHYTSTKKPNNFPLEKVGALMEFYPKGSMLKNLRLLQMAMSPLKRIDFALHLAKGIKIMHDMGYIHRDIKPHNVLVDEHGRPLLIDMGLSRKIGALGQSGTAAYKSPQLAQATKDKTSVVTSIADEVWAFGATLAEMYTQPDQPRSKQWVIWAEKEIEGDMLVKEKVDAKARSIFHRESYPATLIRGCLAFNPEDRFTMDQVIETLEEQKAFLGSHPKNNGCVIA